jgi:hypothetical protein
MKEQERLVKTLQQDSQRMINVELRMREMKDVAARINEQQQSINQLQQKAFES